MTSSVIETAKGKVEYLLLGKGIPILFVHGGHVDCRETIFHRGLDAEKFSFLQVSRPGYGSTPLTETNSTPRGTAELFIALLDTLNIRNITIIGISAGGLTALQMAADYPHRVDRLVLMSALSKKWFGANNIMYRGAKMVFVPWVQRFIWSVYRGSFMMFPQIMTRIMFTSLSTYRPVDFSSDELTDLKKLTFNMRSRAGFRNDLDQVLDDNVLPRIVCPTLILHSFYDNSVDNSHPQHAKRWIKGCRMVLFKNRWGHLLWIGPEYDQVLDELKLHLNEMLRVVGG